MACARGCCATRAEHYQSLRVASSGRSGLTKTTTDDHGTHKVDVVEHWHDRQDVQVRGLAPPHAVYDPTTGRVENVDG
jgi:hypothetical protein